ncbi:Calcium-activated potassium channel subunit alpha-1 [Desmophyllum pertusum]|uniref:Calcium-activated potassium channel subunit alpha-1 n=1 Tax=Desmophyllum pertusum TaxID=174260 RepID=A0A9W9ZVH1_9CNID|nr:Calcium-activated potassium channel subunit alpha-1 [Desmophyllum pertusum]
MDVTDSDLWKTYYIEGANLELYTETLSVSFKDMTFQQVAEICFGKLGLLLIAIETIKPDGEKIFAINPLDKSIEQRTRGYFIAGSATEVKRAFFYCVTCHADVKIPELIKECDCSRAQRLDVHLSALVNHAVIMTQHFCRSHQKANIEMGR